MDELAENIQQNFTDVPTFLRFVHASKRQVILRRLEKHSKDKAVWIKAQKDLADQVVIQKLCLCRNVRLDK